MSCTVVSLPIALAYVIAGIVTVPISAVDVNQASRERRNSINNQVEELRSNIQNRRDILINEDKEEINLCESIYQTAYTDIGLLTKTLKEHGVENLLSNNDNEITCEVEDYKLTFYRENSEQAFNLKIACPENISSVNEKIDDLNNEYTLNVQEEAYLHIIEKLKENNLELEHEEVLDDNTIVLTVNLD